MRLGSCQSAGIRVRAETTAAFSGKLPVPVRVPERRLESAIPSVFRNADNGQNDPRKRGGVSTQSPCSKRTGLCFVRSVLGLRFSGCPVPEGPSGPYCAPQGSPRVQTVVTGTGSGISRKFELAENSIPRQGRRRGVGDERRVRADSAAFGSLRVWSAGKKPEVATPWRRRRTAGLNKNAPGVMAFVWVRAPGRREC